MKASLAFSPTGREERKCRTAATNVESQKYVTCDHYEEEILALRYRPEIIFFKSNLFFTVKSKHFSYELYKIFKILKLVIIN